VDRRLGGDEEVFQREETVGLFERPDAQFVVVEIVLALELHGSQAHANPGVQLIELFPISSKRRTEVLSDTPNQRIEVGDQVKVEIMFSDGQGANLVLELLQGLGSDAPGTAGQDKTHKGVTASVGSDRCLLRTQGESELSQERFDLGPSLFGLGAVLTEHDEVISVAHEAQAKFVEVPVEPIEDDVCQQRRYNPPLRGALGGGHEPTVFKYSTAEKAFEEIEHFSICDMFSNGLQDNLVRQVSKKPLISASRTTSIVLSMQLQSVPAQAQNFCQRFPYEHGLAGVGFDPFFPCLTVCYF
jgi:hypothetical protein